MNSDNSSLRRLLKDAAGYEKSSSHYAALLAWVTIRRVAELTGDSKLENEASERTSRILQDASKAKAWIKGARSAQKRIDHIINVGSEFNDDEVLLILILREEIATCISEWDWRPAGGDRWIQNTDARIVELMRYNRASTSAALRMLHRTSPWYKSSDVSRLAGRAGVVSAAQKRHKS